MAKKKYLVDTSVALAALGQSTAAHNDAYRQAVIDGGEFSSVYLRKEFIRRFISDLIKLAAIISQCTSIEDGLRYYSQAFSIRDVKGAILSISLAWQDIRQADTPGKLAEELGSVAVRLLRRFDRVLKSRIADKTGCQIGGKKLTVDFDRLHESLEQFYTESWTEVFDCAVNGFLKVDSVHGDATKMMEHDDTKNLVVCTNLAKLKSDGKQVSCKDCAKIGDLVIAAEQPRSWIVVHGDANSFPSLCGVLGKPDKYVESVMALQHELVGFEWHVSSVHPALKKIGSAKPSDAT